MIKDIGTEGLRAEDVEIEVSYEPKEVTCQDVAMMLYAVLGDIPTGNQGTM